MTYSAPTSEAFLAAVDEGMRIAKVPKRYRDVDAVTLTHGKDWAYLTGCVGSGKTHTACGILRGYIAKNVSSFGHGAMFSPPRTAFLTAADYLARVKASYDGERSGVFRLRSVPFLVLDDLGQEQPTQWAVLQIFELINHRYNEMLPTVITSQFSRGALARRLSANGGEEQALAIASRLAEMCEVMDLGNIDRRIK